MENVNYTDDFYTNYCKIDKVFPGDKITALGKTYTVWIILYQSFWNKHDVEFMDKEGNYHHWFEADDNGCIIRSGKPGIYLRNESKSCVACIRKAHTLGTFSVRTIDTDGTETYYGRTGSLKTAFQLIENRLGNGWEVML